MIHMIHKVVLFFSHSSTNFTFIFLPLISGSDVRNRIERIRLWKKVLRSVHTIEIAYLAYRKRKIAK
jgi:hypothetical protein